MPAILVTGASRGLGLEFTRQYAAAGWRVWACSRATAPELEALAAASPAVTLARLDVTRHAEIDRLAATLEGEAIDVLLNNAGVMGGRDFAAGAGADQAFGQSDFAAWELAWRTNVVGPMKMAEAFVAHVARSSQRKIITLSSMVGSNTLNTSGGLYGYRASKAAVTAVMKSMAIDLLPRGILAAAVHPGWVRTGMGGPGAPLDVATAVAGVRQVIDGLTAAQAGQLLAWDGAILPF